MKLFAAVLVAMLAFAGLAHAQETVISAEPWVTTFMPFVQAVVLALIGAGVTFGTAYLNARWNIQIDAENRAAFQQSVTNAAGLLLQRLGADAANAKIDVHSKAFAEAIRYVEKGAPEALAKWGITPDRVTEAILAKVPQVTASPTPIMGAPK